MSVKKNSRKYKEFFREAQKSMLPGSVERAEKKADQILLNVRLSELRKEMGVKQVDITGFSQSGISKIEGREDLKVSTLVSYCQALGLGVEIRTFPKKPLPKIKSKILLRAG
jgi:hypothetical protein